MKINSRKSFFQIIAIVLFWVGLSSCEIGSHGERNLEKIRNYQEPVSYDSSKYYKVENVKIDVIKTDIKDLKEQFFVPSRQLKLVNFPCSKCHDKSIEVLKEERKGKSAHWDIALKHAKDEVMNCATCHDMDNPDMLTTITKGSIKVDYSYDQCAQCHSSQFEDWKGGSHGKKLQRWVPPRVSETCVNCHNPHKPKLAKRWPSRLNKVKESAE